MGARRRKAACSGPTTWSSRRAARTRRRPSAGSTSTTTRRTRRRSRRTSTTSARSTGAKDVMLEIDPGARQQSADLPARRLGRATPPVPRHDRRGGDGLERGVHQGDGPLDDRCGARSSFRRRRAVRSCCCAGPALARRCSTSTRRSRCSWSRCGPGTSRTGYEQTWNWGIYPEAITEYWPWLARSIVYGGLATILAFALGLPARLRHRVPRRRLQEPPAVPGHRPVLHELPAADDLLEDHPRRQRARPRSAQGHRARPEPTSGCWRRRPPSSPASPTTSCRS